MLTYFAREEDLRLRVIHGGLMHTLIMEGEATRETLIAALPGLDQTFGRKAITELIDAGLITRVGHGRGQRLVLSAKFQEDRGKPDAFGHQVGLTIEEQRARILNYVDEQGTINRSEAANALSRSADDSIYRLLKGMVEDGLLVPLNKLAARRYRRA